MTPESKRRPGSVWLTAAQVPGGGPLFRHLLEAFAVSSFYKSSPLTSKQNKTNSYCVYSGFLLLATETLKEDTCSCGNEKKTEICLQAFSTPKILFLVLCPMLAVREFHLGQSPGSEQAKARWCDASSCTASTSLFQPHLWVLRVRVQISLGRKVPPWETSLFRWRGYKWVPRRNPKLLRTVREIMLCVVIRLRPSGLITALHRHKIGKEWKQWQTFFSWAPKSLQIVTAAMKLKHACFLEEKLWPTCCCCYC